MNYRKVKRAFDLVVASVLLIPALPILALVAFLLRMTSPGAPTLFAHTRAGLRGRPFRMLKFRTMVPNAHLLGPPVTQANDPRITRIGRILRKTKLDELPQLINVLRGEMSLVGPRPQVPEYVEEFYPDIPRAVILSVRPGITGRTQVWLRHEEAVLAAQPDPIEFYKYDLLPRKVESDVLYVNGMSLLGDLKLLWMTFLRCLSLNPKTQEVASPQSTADSPVDAAKAA